MDWVESHSEPGFTNGTGLPSVNQLIGSKP